MDTEDYDNIIIGGGKPGKTLAPALVANGRKTRRYRDRLHSWLFTVVSCSR
jgi:pyruvate/2-oxoglutarate dehydrogenase complex dihydrolipoamide dehydrogenase (E3) component